MPGHALYPNGERHLRSVSRRAESHVYPACAARRDAAYCAIASIFRSTSCATSILMKSCRRRDAGRVICASSRNEVCAERWPDGVPRQGHVSLVEHELELIAELQYEAVFPDGVRHRGLCPLTEASSVPGTRVCGQFGCLFLPRHHRSRSRAAWRCWSNGFISKERNEPPDIDVDFEHERREEVIQYIYAASMGGSGRRSLQRLSPIDHAAPCEMSARHSGSVICRSAGSRGRCSGGTASRVDDSRVLEAGLDPESPVMRRLLYTWYAS